MQRERRSWRRIVVWALVVLLFIQALNLIMPARIAPVGPFNFIARILIGAATGATSAAEGLGAAWRKYLENAAAVERLESLERQHEQLRFEYDLALRHLAAREALDEMLGWSFSPWRGAVARIVFHDAANRFGTAWLQVPEGARVLNHAVAGADGLIGRVIGQAGRYAQVLLASDVESAVDAVTPNGIRAIVRGTGTRTGRLEFVPRYEELAVGDRLYTSGRDGAYPANIAIGVVESVERSTEQLYLLATVRFDVDIGAAYWVRTLAPDAMLP